MTKILSLSGRGKEISLEIVDYGKNVVWGKKKFKIVGFVVINEKIPQAPVGEF